MAVRMHDGQVETSSELVRRLLAEQLPRLAGLPVRPVARSGTDHALYRLGDDLVARLPIIDWAAEQAERDARWLPALAPRLSLAIPVPVAVGAPGEGYPWSWSVVPWFLGDTPDGDNASLHDIAVTLAEFIRELHAAALPADGGPAATGTARGVPLRNLHGDLRDLIWELSDEVDAQAATEVWERAVAAPREESPGVWIHGDLQPGNVIVRNGRVVAVIDFGALAVGDPAPDLAPAWNLFDGPSRATFRAAVGYDAATWARARGWVLAPALQGLRYYQRSRPELSAAARQRINAVLADPFEES